MNFTQIHEQLRIEMLRRIQRGTLSVSLLSRQTGLGVSHVSNFLHSRRKLSLESMDRILAAQHLLADDLLERSPGAAAIRQDHDIGPIPVVSRASALFEPVIRPSAVQMTLRVPPGAVHVPKARSVPARRFWQRFVAVRVDPNDALSMEPVLMPDALAVIDRHYTSLMPYRAGRPSLYAIRSEAHLTIRYAEYVAMRLVLRPMKQSSPIDLIEIGSETSPADLIAGRVVLILNEL